MTIRILCLLLTLALVGCDRQGADWEEAQHELELEREREREARREAEQGTHRVQLAAVRSRDQASQSIELLEQRLGQVLGNVGLESERTNGLYRLVTQPVSRDQASELCETLKQRGQDCLVRRR